MINSVNDTVIINAGTYESIQGLSKEQQWKFYDTFILSGLTDSIIECDDSAVNTMIKLICPTQIAATQRHNEAIKRGREGGLANPHEEQFTIEQMLELKERGYSNRQVADELGCSYSTVQKKIREYNTKKAEETVQDYEEELPF